MSRFTTFVEQILRKNGWYPNRRVDDAVFGVWIEVLCGRYEFELFPAAEAALREFGGLKIVQNCAGKTAARETFAFDPLWQHNNYRPAIAHHAYTLEYVWGILMGKKVFPLSLNPDDPEYVSVISESGAVYSIGYNSNLEGKTIEEALEKNIIGIESKRLKEVGPDDYDALLSFANAEANKRLLKWQAKI